VNDRTCISISDCYVLIEKNHALTVACSLLHFPMCPRGRVAAAAPDPHKKVQGGQTGTSRHGKPQTSPASGSVRALPVAKRATAQTAQTPVDPFAPLT
jgi:hypothetical protein